ncbi:MAG TPA: hypothetical protein VGU20_11130 [Stellaceae bacterium]|nr:hypothetical protein [Stellaceae bacterium]
MATRLHLQESIGAKIFGAFIAMGLITGLLGGFGYYVLSSAGGFVEATYDGPLQAVDFARAASLVFTQMDKEVLRRHSVAAEERPAVDAKIDELGKSFFEDLAVAEERAPRSPRSAPVSSNGMSCASPPRRAKASPISTPSPRRSSSDSTG